MDRKFHVAYEKTQESRFQNQKHDREHMFLVLKFGAHTEFHISIDKFFRCVVESQK
jgi:hypothetical protein